MKQKIKKLFTIHSSLFTFPPAPLPLREGVRGRVGFTLVELAMVLVIIGLLIGLGVQLVGPLTKRIKQEDTRETVNAAKETVKGYVVKNGYLPASLEVAGARKLDAWGNDLVYYAASEFDASGDDACGVTATTLGGSNFEVHECKNDSCANPADYNLKSNVGFIVFSKGSDANEAGTDPNKDGIPPFKVRIQDSSYTDGTTYNYDDVVAYVSLDEIRSLRGCAQQLTITSPNSLSEGEEDSFYSYEMQATGGRSPYTWGDGSLWSGSGLSLNTSGLISGTINVNSATTTGELTACSASITITASELAVQDSAGATSTSGSDFTIPVRPRELTITTQTLSEAKTGVSYSVTFQGKGGRSSYTWSITAGSLPSGLSLSSGGVLSGTPTAQGVYNFTVSLADTCTTASKGYSLNVIDSCLSGGIYVLNSTGSNTGYKISGVGCVLWSISKSITVSPVDTMEFYNNSSCSSERCKSQTLDYNFFQGYDADIDCSVRWTGVAVATCTFSDL